MATRFKIVVPTYDSPDWIGRCLSSLESQTHPDFQVCVVDDASPPSSQQETISKICDRNGWLSLTKPARQGALHSLLLGAQEHHPDDEDVLIVVDGDDWLYNENVLTRLATIYDQEDVWITYGQYLHHRTGIVGDARRPRRRDIRRRAYRKMEWRFGHLRTFKYLLWRRIEQDHLRAPDGSFLMAACDLAAMYPMLEMAGPRQRFVSEILYIYNDINHHSHHHSRPTMQQQAAQYVRSLPRYKVLP